MARARRTKEKIGVIAVSAAAAVAAIAALRSPGEAAAQDSIPDAHPTGMGPWLEDRLPSYFFSVRFLGLEMWQWLGLALWAFAAVALGYLVARAVAMISRRFVRRTTATWDDVLLEKGVGPFRLAVIVFAFFFGAQLLGLAPAAQRFVASACKVAGVLAVTWFGLRATDIASGILRERIRAKNLTAAMTLLPMGRRAAKVFILIIAFISLLQNIGFNVTGLVAGLGVGGLAIALAAQKTLENLFGGIAILADRPVKVGDLCTVGPHNGVVEDIGLRSTRIRTSARTLVSIPNAEMSTARIENFAARDYTVMQATLPLVSDASPEQLRRVLSDIRAALHAHRMVAADPRRVSLVHVGPHSYDIEVFAGIRTTDQNTFIQHREEIYLTIIDIVAACGTRFTLPPQAIYAAAPPAPSGPMKPEVPREPRG